MSATREVPNLPFCQIYSRSQLLGSQHSAQPSSCLSSAQNPSSLPILCRIKSKDVGPTFKTCHCSTLPCLPSHLMDPLTISPTKDAFSDLTSLFQPQGLCICSSSLFPQSWLLALALSSSSRNWPLLTF